MALLSLLTFFAFSPPAHAKSTEWWDCFFREFELCSGKVNDPDAPQGAQAAKGFCDSKAHSTCDEEERARTVQGGGAGSNGSKGKGTASGGSASTIQITPVVAKPSEETVGVPSSLVVEGDAPSGDRTVLGVDVTFSIAQVAEKYASRNVRGCKPIDDLYSRILCLDAPGGSSSDAPIELEFYRGRLVRLTYDAPATGPVKLRPAVSVAEDKTGSRAMLSTEGAACRARFALGGGTMALTGAASEGKGEPCLPANVDAAALSRVEWSPSAAVASDVGKQRQQDRAPAQQKRDDVLRAKALLQL